MGKSKKEKTISNEIKNNPFYKELLRHKKIAESQFVLSLYKVSDWFFEYEIDAADISDISWRMYFILLQELLLIKKIKQVDLISMENHVSTKKEAFIKLYQKNGGYDTIETGVAMIEEENVETYYNEIQRYKVLLHLVELGFPIEKNWETYSACSLEQLSDALEGMLARAFINSDFEEDNVEDIFEGIEEMIQRANDGVDRGLPLKSKLLDSIQNGLALGNITMLAANSGVGKTFLTITQTLPVCIELEQPLLIVANEEDRSKWQKEIITWHINNIQGVSFNKERFYQGGFSEEEKVCLKNAVTWFRTNVESGLIKFVNLNNFSMSKTIKIIKKYATTQDYKYFIIDTLKLDNDNGSNMTDQAWLQLQQNMVKLYNVVKPSNKNCHVWITYQMSKTQKGKYLSQNDLGMSKNVADVVSSLMLVRMVGESEKGEGTGALTARTSEGKMKKLKPDLDYFVVFWDKNRQGATSEQAIIRVDRGRNIVKDVGKVRISENYA